MLFISPLSVQLKRKKYILNLNQYRNWHYKTSNNIKCEYLRIISNQLKGKKIEGKISISFILYKGSNRKSDRSNVLSIHEKFFCDSLVENKCIVDDNDNYIESTHYFSGGVDKLNPRVEIKILRL